VSLVSLFVFAFGIAWIGSLLWTPWVARLALKFNIVAKRDQRRTHRGLRPLLGGVAVFAAILPVIIWALHDSDELYGWLMILSCVVALGMVDDRHEIRPRTKMICEFFLAFGLIALHPYYIAPWRVLGFPKLMSIIFDSCWIVAVVNAINFIDGADGLCPSASGIMALLMAVAGLALPFQSRSLVMVGAATAGACFGFLRYNWRPARIFLGDSGSLLLGFILADLSLRTVSSLPLRPVNIWIATWFLGYPLLDMGVVMLRRKWAGSPMLMGDRSHFHHRLDKIGMRIVTYVKVLQVITLCGTGTALAFTLSSSHWRWVSFTFSIAVCFGFLVWLNLRERQVSLKLRKDELSASEDRAA